MEDFDILDATGKPTGEVRSAADAHTFGLTHRTVHVWLVNARKEILLQKRSPQMRAFPGQWDISVGGHIPTGEHSLDAAIRETHEELGLAFPPSAFEFLFTIKEHFEPSDGRYIDDEFQDVYLVRSDATIADIALQEGEVTEVRWLSLDEFERWIQGAGELITPHHEEQVRLLDHLRKN